MFTIARSTFFLLMLIQLSAMTACKKSINGPDLADVPALEEKIVKNIKSAFFHNTYLKLSTGEIVENPELDNWDIAFEHAQIKINGGNMSNPIRTGEAKALLLNVSYEDIKEIPSLGNLKQDNNKDNFALGYRSGGQSWYYLDASLFYIPYDKKVIFVQSADKKGFAKIQVLSFYRDMPNLKGETYDSMSSREGYYTIRYQYIERGQRFF